MAKSKLRVRETLEKSLNFIWKNPIVILPFLIPSLLFSIVEGLVSTYEIGTMYMSAIIVAEFAISIYMYVLSVQFINDRMRRKVSIIKSMEKLTPGKAVRWFAATILTGILVILGFAAFILPGIYIMFKLIFFTYFIILENKGIRDSFKRSWAITKGSLWKICLLSLSIFAVMMVLSFAAGLWSAAPSLLLTELQTDLLIETLVQGVTILTNTVSGVAFLYAYKALKKR